jgi:hypothetical protein
MTRYEPAVEVLPLYTDEGLAADTVLGAGMKAKLLTVPAEYRQAVEIEVMRRTSVITNVRGFVSRQFTGDPGEVRSQVVAEVLAQLAAERQSGRPGGR